MTLSWIFLPIFSLGTVNSITCPKGSTGDPNNVLQCSTSSYCQSNYAITLFPGGRQKGTFESLCGIPHSPEKIAGKSVNTQNDEIRQAVGDLTEKFFCQEAPTRWCRVTPGEMGKNQNGEHYSRALVECRCTEENCLAFLKNGGVGDGLPDYWSGDGLLGEIKNRTKNFGDEWRLSEGECSEYSECSYSRISVLTLCTVLLIQRLL